MTGEGLTGVRAAGASTRTGPGRSATCACEGEGGEKRGEGLRRGSLPLKAAASLG